MEEYQVTIINLNTKMESQLMVTVDEAETTENISIRAIVCDREITVLNSDYFPAFQEFRDKLLRLGFGIKCNGSRINAVQSGMMGATDKVYLVKMGKQALVKDIVHIWDNTQLNNFPDTEKQNRFFGQWVSSH